MTTPRDTDSIVAAWLEEGPARLPDTTRRAIAVTTRTTHQTRRPTGLPWRFPTMNGGTRIAFGAVAVVVVALGGVYLINRAPDSSAGGTPATASPTPTPLSFDNHPQGALEPGVYVLDHIEGLDITFTVPTGWDKFHVPATLWAAPTSDARLGFAAVDNLYKSPCASLATVEPPVGPTVADLAAALDSVPGVAATSTDVTFLGFSGKQIDLVATGAWDPCAAGEPTLFKVHGGGGDWPPPDPTDQFKVWILDVGGHRLMVQQVIRTGATASDRAELQAIFDSIRIDVQEPGPAPSSTPTP